MEERQGRGENEDPFVSDIGSQGGEVVTRKLDDFPYLYYSFI